MTKDQREIQRKLRIQRYAEETGHVAKTCRYFGIGRASFYRWRKAYAERGEAGILWAACDNDPELRRNDVEAFWDILTDHCLSSGFLEPMAA